MGIYQFSEAERKHLEQLPTSLAVYQYADGKVYPLVLSDGYRAMFRLPDREKTYRLLSEDVLYNTHPDDVERLKDAVQRFITQGGRYEVIFRGRKYEGEGHHIIHGIGEHVFREDGSRLAFVTFMDEGEYTGDDDTQASSLNRAFNEALHEESIFRASRYDHLTGLPRMTRFIELAEEGKNSIVAEGKVGALLYIDLNGMKNFNDSYGFAEGDKLLCAYASLLERAFGRERCCHISGDRFAAFSTEDGLENTLRHLFREAERLNGGHSLPVRAGIYLTSIEDVPVSSAYDRAKIACDQIPKADVSFFSYYSDSMREDIKQRQHILSHFDEAIQKQWIQVYYQPIIRAVTGKVCDEEALARWIDPVKGFLSPAEFIPALEEAGLIYKLDLYVLEQVLEKMKRQSASGIPVVPHSINLSRSDFDVCDMVEEIRLRVDASGVGREKITIEITENVIGSGFDFMKEQVTRFRKLGFAVWMDDFGSGYSSLDFLSSIKVDLIKFDIGFLRRLDEEEDAKIVLAEMMKMTTSLGLDTVCEGVEKEAHVHFLRDIGCSKLQGFYYSRPVPYEQIVERNNRGIQIGYENPEETSYYETIGRVNLFELGAIVSEDDKAFRNSYNMLPMGVIEIKGEYARIVRSNQAYRDFLKKTVRRELQGQESDYVRYTIPFLRHIGKNCTAPDFRSFFDERMPDGATVHSFARRIGMNQANGAIAVAVAILSVSEPEDGESYADIARALAADYYNIYVVDLDTDRFIEYSSQAGEEEMAMERHGEDFFRLARQDTMTRIYEEDREPFLSVFSREKIIEALDSNGVFTTSYRLIDSGTPVYAGLKATRMKSGKNRIIIGVSIIDAQVKQKEAVERVHQQNSVIERIAALTGEYYALYLADPESGAYSEYSVSADYSSLGFDKEGDDIFRKARSDAQIYADPQDISLFLEQFTKEKVMREIEEKGRYQIRYRLMIKGQPKRIILTAAKVVEAGREKLIFGVNVLDD